MIACNLSDLITLTQLAKQLPERPHPSTCARWATRGIRGIRLKTYLVGGRRCTTLADFSAWVAATSRAASGRQS